MNRHPARAAGPILAVIVAAHGGGGLRRGHPAGPGGRGLPSPRLHPRPPAEEPPLPHVRGRPRHPRPRRPHRLSLEPVLLQPRPVGLLPPGSRDCASMEANGGLAVSLLAGRRPRKPLLRDVGRPRLLRRPQRTRAPHVHQCAGGLWGHPHLPVRGRDVRGAPRPMGRLARRALALPGHLGCPGAPRAAHHSHVVRGRHRGGAAAGLYGLSLLRPYAAVWAAGAAAAALLLTSARRASAVRVLAAGIAGLVLLVAGLGFLGAGLVARADLSRIAMLREGFQGGGSSFGASADISSLSGAVAYLPIGLAYFLLAPFPWQAGSALQLSTMIEQPVWYLLRPQRQRGDQRGAPTRCRGIDPGRVHRSHRSLLRSGDLQHRHRLPRPRATRPLRLPLRGRSHRGAAGPVGSPRRPRARCAPPGARAQPRFPPGGRK